jgi:pimeloyl-ACP methyl ester carboxylesterase
MRVKRLRRSSYPRQRRGRGLFWTLLGLFMLGAVASALAGLRRWTPKELKPEPAGPRPRPKSAEPEPPAAAPGEVLWLAGPAGNLYIRDGGAAEHPLAVPVLFLHSLAGNGGQWALQLDHLRRHRRAVAIDLRGHGESDPAENGDYTIEGMAGDVAAAADQLGLRRFLLAGHSFGSLVAIEYASQHPERVAGLLLVDPNGDMSRAPEEESRPFLEALRADPLSELESYFGLLVVSGDPDAGRWVIEDLRLTHEGAIVPALESSLKYPALPALERYTGPRLSIISDANRLSYSLHNLLPDLETRRMSGTGHWVMMDRPEVFNRLMDEFVERVEAGQ